METKIFIEIVGSLVVIIFILIWVMIDIVKNRNQIIGNQKHIIECQVKDTHKARADAQKASYELKYVLRRMSPQEAHQLRDEVSEAIKKAEEENNLAYEAMLRELESDIKTIIEEKWGY